MHDIITIGSATVDIFMKSNEFHLQPTSEGLLLCQEYGSKMDISEFEMQSGGAGTNTAVGFARLGFQTVAVVEIGKDIFAQVIIDELTREHVDTRFVVSEKGENTALSVLLISKDGGRSALTYRGASSQLEARDLPWQELKETRWIHLSNVGGNKELLLRLFDHLRHSNTGLSWNPGARELGLLAAGDLKIEMVHCDTFILNKEEWANILPAQQAILRNISHVVVTDGKQGGDIFLHGQHQHHFLAEEVPTKQETGAGDAFAVGFVAAQIHGLSLLECADWGLKNAGNVVQYMGAKTGLLYKKDFTQKRLHPAYV